MFHFMGSAMGASANPCSEQYAGVKPFSEPESVALAAFVKSFDNIRLYLSFHSYGQLLLFPYVNQSEFYTSWLIDSSLILFISLKILGILKTTGSELQQLGM